ncbi:MAG TPA: cupin domain-containing protein [Bacteroidales bacterium]|nr:cupin domain-containing protein [Bacteroidales bacterium]
MKNLVVKNVNSIEAQKINRPGTEFFVKSIISQEDIAKLRANFVEVEPGHFAYSYHYHEANEEIFYIISGKGTVRTAEGKIEVKAGDVIGFPTGEKGAHVMMNESKDEKLVYIDIGTTIKPEIVHMPDTKKLMVIGSEVNTFDV